MKNPPHTLQELARNSNASTAESAIDGAHAWTAAFKAQATQDMMDRVARYIAKRATWIRAQHGSAANEMIKAMVVEALGDTFAGVVTWDPLRCPLHAHLKSVIRSRLAHELERAEDYQHVNIEDARALESNAVLLDAGKAAPTKVLSKHVKEFTQRLREQRPTTKRC